jgi:divalent metal cation (Fe/Co/Zn/Cd) transporter
VAGFIVHVGWHMTGELLGHLMDGVDPDLLTRAEHAALSVKDVEHVHARGRWIGRSLLIDLEGFVTATLTITETDEIGRRVDEAVSHAVPECRAVLWSARALPSAPHQ